MNLTTSAALKITVLALAIAGRTVEAQTYPEFAVRVPKSVLERYAGEWVYPGGQTVMARLHGDTLFREIPGQQVAFVPLSQTLFRLGPVFTAEFVTDQAGGMTQILSDGAAVEFRLRRTGAPPEPPPPATPPVRVPRTVLERYVGVYQYVPGQMSRTDLSITVSLKGDTLIRYTGGEPVVLTPISETRFKVGNTSIMVEFVVDEGRVTQILGSGRQQMLARLASKR